MTFDQFVEALVEAVTAVRPEMLTGCVDGAIRFRLRVPMESRVCCPLTLVARHRFPSREPFTLSEAVEAAGELGIGRELAYRIMDSADNDGLNYNPFHRAALLAAIGLIPPDPRD
jgi:hypothetical protein